MSPNSFQSIIIPISAVATPRMLPLVQHYESNFRNVWASNYAVRPGKLFVGVDMNLCIITAHRSTENAIAKRYTTAYFRWASEQRTTLFDTIKFTKQDHLTTKIGDHILEAIIKKATGKPNLNECVLMSDVKATDKVFVHSGGRYYRKCALTQYSNEYKSLSVPTDWRYSVVAALSSSAFYVLWLALSDCFHVTKRDIDCLKIEPVLLDSADLQSLGKRLLDDLIKNSVVRQRQRKDGATHNEINFYVGKSKNLIDSVDASIANYYGFTPVELDYIINYDIKYRMGQGLEEDGDD